MIYEHFANYHHQIRETCNNCFLSKKLNASLCQAKIGKHECYEIEATYTNLQSVQQSCFKMPVCDAFCCIRQTTAY